MIDWHASSGAIITSCRNNPICGYRCLFCRLIFVGHDTEETLLWKECLTICQKTEYLGTHAVETRTYSSLSKMLLDTLCDWSWLHRVHFKCSLLQFQLWQNIAWFSTFRSINWIGIPHLITLRTQFSLQARKCPDLVVGQKEHCCILQFEIHGFIHALILQLHHLVG